MTIHEPDASTTLQLNELGYTGGKGEHIHQRPLLVCDVDEVILHLVDPLAQVLLERGYSLKSHSFQLTGNIYHKATGREASQQEVRDGLAQLFAEQADRQHIVDGAVECLNLLARSIDILFLTNMPHEFGTIRRNYLAENGLDFPLITNTRSKVPAIRTVLRHCRQPMGFIDDTPKNLDQVRNGIPEVHLFHFMANEEFRGLAGEIEGVHSSSGEWGHASENIQSILMENTDRT